MLGGLIAIAIAIWQYRTAISLEEKPWPWVIHGLITYYVTVFLLTWLVVTPVLGALHASNSTLLAVLIAQSPVLAGFLVALWVRTKLVARMRQEHAK